MAADSLGPGVGHMSCLRKLLLHGHCRPDWAPALCKVLKLRATCDVYTYIYLPIIQTIYLSSYIFIDMCIYVWKYMFLSLPSIYRSLDVIIPLYVLHCLVLLLDIGECLFIDTTCESLSLSLCLSVSLSL